MFLGVVKLNCKQQVMVYDNYEIINYIDEKEKALTRIEEELKCYIDRYAKNHYRSDGFLRYIKKHQLRHSLDYCYVLIAPMATIEAEKIRTYNPLNDLSTLFMDLAKVDSVLNEEATLKFIQSYGLPIRERRWLVNDNNIDIPLLFLYQFNKELTTYKKHFELFLAFKNNDYKQMRKSLQAIKSMDNNINGTLTSHSTKEDIIHEVKRILTLKIKSRKIKYKPSLGPDDFSTEVIFGDLIDVAYFQMGQNLINDEQLSLCLECGSYFVKKHGNMKYCPPPPNGMRSTCQNNHQVKAYREKIK